MQEVGMANWMIIRFAALATFSMALVAAPSFTPAFAAGGGGGGVGGADESPPSASGTKATHSQRAKKASKHSSIDDPAFAQGYRAAYSTIYDRHDYAAAIKQLQALGPHENRNGANLMV